MKEFVLINRKTGDLFSGYRISLFDKFLVNADIEGNGSYGIHLSRLEHDGWIIYHPHESFVGFWLWFNNKGVEKIFENLGEL